MFFSFFVTVTTRLKWPQNKISMPPPFGTCLFYYQTSSLWPSIFTHFISAWSYKSDRPLGLCPTSKVKVISGSLWHGQDTRSLDSVVCNTVPVIPNALYCENCKNTHTHTQTPSIALLNALHFHIMDWAFIFPSQARNSPSPKPTNLYFKIYLKASHNHTNKPILMYSEYSSYWNPGKFHYLN